MDFGKLAQQAQSALGGGAEGDKVADAAASEGFADKAKAFASSAEGKKTFTDVKGAFTGGEGGFAADAKAFASSDAGKEDIAAAKAKLF
ncbi:hypothetical protein RQP46_005781 [Phenoliferia psychrophenolica]